jgi:hypothetical protein
MALEKYTIGGNVLETETFEAFADIPQNRVLLAEKLTAEASMKPDIVQGLTTVEEVFEYFKPKIEVEFETEEGISRKETFGFKNLGDFGVKGITSQSKMLQDLTMKRAQYQKIIRQLKTNKLLKQALADKNNKENIIQALQALIMELSEAK